MAYKYFIIDLNKKAYKICILNGKKIYRMLYKSEDLSKTRKKFKELLETNEVLIPLKVINNESIKPAKYTLCILETKAASNGDPVVRDYLGRIIRDREINKRWLLLDKADWKMEETYIIHGLSGRYDCKFILKEIIVKNSNVFKQITCFNNKLVIECDDDRVFIILCKTRPECGRLHDTLLELCNRFSIKGCLFFGHVSDFHKGRLFKIIKDVTGWSDDRIRSTSTRPGVVTKRRKKPK